jgi:hypothetical protein
VLALALLALMFQASQLSHSAALMESSPLAAHTTAAFEPQSISQRVRHAAVPGIIYGASIQFSGINAILYFAPSVWRGCGVNPLLMNCIALAMNVLCCSVGSLISKRWDPRAPFTGGLACIGGVLIVLGSVLVSGTQFEGRPALLATTLFVFYVLYSICVGPAFYVIATHNFRPAHIRLGSSCALNSNLIVGAAVSLTFPLLIEGFGSGTTGLGWSMLFFAMGSVVFSGLMLFGTPNSAQMECDEIADKVVQGV